MRRLSFVFDMSTKKIDCMLIEWDAVINHLHIHVRCRFHRFRRRLLCDGVEFAADVEVVVFVSTFAFVSSFFVYGSATVSSVFGAAVPSTSSAFDVLHPQTSHPHSPPFPPSTLLRINLVQIITVINYLINYCYN
eukprot:m.44859 g.44859  ORF g.44859 m.44859 type:complete len:135 (+) comp10638_c0_seq1:939-1343(+)